MNTPMYPYHYVTCLPNCADLLAAAIRKADRKDSVLIEFHQKLSDIFSDHPHEGLNDFRLRALQVSGLFSEKLLYDKYPAVIHVALRHAGKWMIAKQFATNYFVSAGEKNILKVRKACIESRVPILHSDEVFDEWMHMKFGSVSSN